MRVLIPDILTEEEATKILSLSYNRSITIWDQPLINNLLTKLSLTFPPTKPSTAPNPPTGEWNGIGTEVISGTMTGARRKETNSSQPTCPGAAIPHPSSSLPQPSSPGAPLNSITLPRNTGKTTTSQQSSTLLVRIMTPNSTWWNPIPEIVRFC